MDTQNSQPGPLVVSQHVSVVVHFAQRNGRPGYTVLPPLSVEFEFETTLSSLDSLVASYLAAPLAEARRRYPHLNGWLAVGWSHNQDPERPADEPEHTFDDPCPPRWYGGA